MTNIWSQPPPAPAHTYAHTGWISIELFSMLVDTQSQYPQFRKAEMMTSISQKLTLVLPLSLTIFGRHQYFCRASFFGFVVPSALSFKSRVDSPAVCFIALTQLISELHLWCNTCWPLGKQHGGWAVSIHIHGNKHWWGSSPGSGVPLSLHVRI